MSINCWFVFKLKEATAKKKKSLLEHCPAEIHSSSEDRVITFYDEHRHEAFCRLDPNEQSEIIQSRLGDAIIQTLEDPRGVYVAPEVGQDFEGQTYLEIVEPDGLWVACTSIQPFSETVADPTEDAFEEVMA